jgi:hypothetical protein
MIARNRFAKYAMACSQEARFEGSLLGKCESADRATGQKSAKSPVNGFEQDRRRMDPPIAFDLQHRTPTDAS